MAKESSVSSDFILVVFQLFLVEILNFQSIFCVAFEWFSNGCRRILTEANGILIPH